MNTIKSIIDWCRRYIRIPLLLVTAFIIFLIFFNEHSLLTSFELDKKIEKQQAELHALQDSLSYYRRQNILLDADPVTMERVVREKHHMRRPGEDVYIFTE